MFQQHAQTWFSGQWSSNTPCIWSGEMRSRQLNLQQHKFKVLDQITSLYIQLSIGTEQPKEIAESTLSEGCFKIQVRHISQRHKDTQYWLKSRGFTRHLREGGPSQARLCDLPLCLLIAQTHISDLPAALICTLLSNDYVSQMNLNLALRTVQTESPRILKFFFFQLNCTLLHCGVYKPSITT